MPLSKLKKITNNLFAYIFLIYSIPVQSFATVRFLGDAEEYVKQESGDDFWYKAIKKQPHNKKAEKVDLFPARLNLSYKFSDDRDLAKAEFLLPIVQNSTNMLFLDLRGWQDEFDVREGNFGIGYRNIDGKHINGVYAFYDSRVTNNDNKFAQITTGFEYLTEKFDLRANYYIPLNDKEATNTETRGGDAIFSGNSVEINDSDSFELALRGYDVEFGGEIIPFMPFIRVLGGYYNFISNREHNLDIELEGFRGRSEVTIFSSKNHKLIIEGEYTDDELRDERVFYGLRYSLIFGRNKQENGVRTTKLQQRMTSPIIRDIDVVTTEILPSETASLRRSIGGESGNRLIHVDADADAAINGDGTFESPYDNINDATTNSDNADIIYVNAGSYVEGVSLQDEQKIIGAGSPLLLSYLTDDINDANISLIDATEYSNLSNNAVDVIVAASDNLITGFSFSDANNAIMSTSDNIEITNNRFTNSVTGVNITNSTDSINIIADNIFLNNTGYGINIISSGATNSTNYIINNQLTDNANGAINITNNGTRTITNNLTSNTANNIAENTSSGISGFKITSSSGNVINNFNNNNANNFQGEAGFYLENNGTSQMTNNFNLAGFDAMANNASNNLKGFQFESNSSATMTNNINNNASQNNISDGFYFNNVASAATQNNTLLNNSASVDSASGNISGFRFIGGSGIVNNTLNNNSSTGFTSDSGFYFEAQNTAQMVNMLNTTGGIENINNASGNARGFYFLSNANTSGSMTNVLNNNVASANSSDGFYFNNTGVGVLNNTLIANIATTSNSDNTRSGFKFEANNGAIINNLGQNSAQGFQQAGFYFSASNSAMMTNNIGNGEDESRNNATGNTRGFQFESSIANGAIMENIINNNVAINNSSDGFYFNHTGGGTLNNNISNNTATRIATDAETEALANENASSIAEIVANINSATIALGVINQGADINELNSTITALNRDTSSILEAVNEAESMQENNDVSTTIANANNLVANIANITDDNITDVSNANNILVRLNNSDIGNEGDLTESRLNSEASTSDAAIADPDVGVSDDNDTAITQANNAAGDASGAYGLAQDLYDGVNEFTYTDMTSLNVVAQPITNLTDSAASIAGLTLESDVTNRSQGAINNANLAIANTRNVANAIYNDGTEGDEYVNYDSLLATRTNINNGSSNAANIQNIANSTRATANTAYDNANRSGFKVEASNGTVNNVFNNNTATNFVGKAGFDFRSTGTAEITNNLSANNASNNGNGFSFVAEDSSIMTNNLNSDINSSDANRNTARNNRYSGFAFEARDSVSIFTNNISNNLARDNMEAGFSFNALDASMQNNVLNNNIAESNAAEGFVFITEDASSSNNFLNNNEARRNIDNGFEFVSNGTSIVNNNFNSNVSTSNNGDGFSFEVSGDSDVTNGLTGNRALHNRVDGFSFASSSSLENINSLTNNLAEANSTIGSGFKFIASGGGDMRNNLNGSNVARGFATLRQEGGAIPTNQTGFYFMKDAGLGIMYNSLIGQLGNENIAENNYNGFYFSSEFDNEVSDGTNADMINNLDFNNASDNFANGFVFRAINGSEIEVDLESNNGSDNAEYGFSFIAGEGGSSNDTTVNIEWNNPNNNVANDNVSEECNSDDGANNASINHTNGQFTGCP